MVYICPAGERAQTGDVCPAGTLRTHVAINRNVNFKLGAPSVPDGFFLATEASNRDALVSATHPCFAVC